MPQPRSTAATSLYVILRSSIYTERRVKITSFTKKYAPCLHKPCYYQRLVSVNTKTRNKKTKKSPKPTSKFVNKLAPVNKKTCKTYNDKSLNVKHQALASPVRAAHRSVYDCAQLCYTIQHRTVPIIFPLILILSVPHFFRLWQLKLSLPKHSGPYWSNPPFLIF